MSLTDTKVKNAKPSEKVVKLTDGFGLYLLVHTNGSKYWQSGYRFEGKQKVFSIGVYPAVSLADARQRRDEAKKLLAAGVDPSAKKRADNKSVQEKRNNTRAFKTVAKSWFATKTTWSEDYQRSVWTRLETYLFPAIGEKDIAELDTGDLLVPIIKIEKLGYMEIAMRVKQYATAIMRYAVQQKMIRFNPAYDLEGAVQKPQTEHRPAIELEEIPTLLERIEGYQGRSRLTLLAIKLNQLIFVRSSELRFARWSEIDFNSALWVIPEQREAIEGIKHSSRGAKCVGNIMFPCVVRRWAFWKS